MSGTPPRLLIVEDNPADVLFLRHAFHDHHLSAAITVAKDGGQAIEYLERCTDDECPGLVIIDINLPKRDGIEVLRKCRFTPALAETKTLVLTSSDDPGDHLRAELIGVDAYIRKPRTLSGFADVVGAIRDLLRPV